MTSPVDSDVQLGAEGSGPKVRTRTVTTLLPAATPDLPPVATDVKVQVIATADAAGNILDEKALLEALHDLVEALHEVRDLITLALR